MRNVAVSRRILFAASECAPWAKTGGLGDVVAGLSRALRRLGHDVRVVLPLYASVDRAGLWPDGSACVHMGGGEEHWVGVWSGRLEGDVPVWFVDFERYFGRPGLYHDRGGEYRDNARRFGLLSKCALQLCKDRGFVPEVMHLHDWMTAPAAALLKTWDRVRSPLSATASVLTIHNIGHQGVSDAVAHGYLGLGAEHFHADAFEDHGRVNLLKGGIAFADAITTVSPTHARELLTPEGGHGLAPYLNARAADLHGILNGVDYALWDPATDPLIPARYDRDDLAGKAVCKRELQRRFGLEAREDLPLFGVVSRFAHQKGFHLLREALPAALDQMAMQVVVLGSGDPDTEDFFRWLAWWRAGRVGVHVGFSEALSHWIEAGSDFFLMPSLYEPCGLNQIYSMKYGALPVVRATGGLEDTVENYDERTGGGTGFKLYDPAARAVFDTIGWAVSTWFDRPHHVASLRGRAMERDHSWDGPAAAYLDVYARARRRRLDMLRRDDPAHPLFAG
jgi:starch synthase